MSKGIDKKLDDAWSLLIRQKGHCEVCGKTTGLNAHHIVGRRNLTLRYDKRNGVCLCQGCHVFSKLSAHQDPEWFHGWLVKNRKRDIDYIGSKRNNVVKRTKKDKEQLYESLLERFEE